MNLTRATVRLGLLEVLVTTALGATAAALIAVPAASAQPEPPCTAAMLAHTINGVAGEAAGYLDTHPGANQALTDTGSQSPQDAEAALRAYFTANPIEFLDLKNIARPLSDLRNQCNQTVTGGQIAALFRVFGPELGTG
jgi:heme-binding protein